MEKGKTKIKGFKECDTCSKKPGSPTLCEGCLHNREVIDLFEEKLNKIEEELVSMPLLRFQTVKESKIKNKIKETFLRHK